jgi:uncharacterized membrane protein
MAYILMLHNYNLYDQSIVKITFVESGFHHESDLEPEEKYYEQKLKGIFMNGSYKGKEVYMLNQYSTSGVNDEEYKVGDRVFVDVKKSENNDFEGKITGLKRDQYFVVAFMILLAAILITTSKKGLLTILSLFVNIFIFWTALELYQEGKNILLLSRYMMVLFTIISLILISGINRKTLAAVLSTFATVGISFVIFTLSMKFGQDMDYAYMDYITGPSDLHLIFESQLLIAGLGAIMDIAISMAAMTQELIVKDPEISFQSILKSGRELGHDIMGTMINVMLFTYICGSIPMIILKMNLEIRLATIIAYHMPLELYRFLLGGIGIMLAIPLSLATSILFLRKWRR